MRKSILLFFFIIILGGLSITNAQSIELHAIITQNNGQEYSFYLNDDDQFSFEGQETLIINAQGSTVTFNINDIRKIEFVDVTGTEELHAENPYFFPNPVKMSIVFGNIIQGQIVRIFSLEGYLLRQFKANANESIDLGDLPSGLYILNLCEKNYKLLKL